MNRSSGTSRQSGGSALVVVLCFIFLLSGLVVAVLIGTQLDRSGTQSYYQAARAQELATGATEEILSDLRDEIAAGSLPLPSPSPIPNPNPFVVGGKTIYVPTTPLASQPARIGFTMGANGDYATDVDSDHIPPSLVRVSRYIDQQDPSKIKAVYPDTSYDISKLALQRASTASSVTPSSNGRTISPVRWARAGLMTADPSVYPKHFYNKTNGVNNTPNWVYFTRTGGQQYTDANVASLKPSSDLTQKTPVIGRYAYVIYDEGGLLDINCAGYPPSLTTDDVTNGPGAIRGKSSVAYATLTALPGLVGKDSQVKDLINWRSGGSITASNGFFAASQNWLKTNFLKTVLNDSPLLSRKDLIDYLNKKIGTTAPLPYLGTFSRALAAPSMRPATPLASDGTKSNPDYAAQAENTDVSAQVANLDLANVRFTKAGSIPHYSDDATAVPTPYTVKVGDPLLQCRFSLARLAWLAQADPSTGTAPPLTYVKPIQSVFGLVWDFPSGVSGTSANGGNRCWNYVGGGGSIGIYPGRIKTLAEVAGEGREPDFFELLKAAILSGSLGKSPGHAAFMNGQHTPYTGDWRWPFAPTPADRMGPAGLYCSSLIPLSTTATIPAPAGIPDMQIIRIGANIIDQFDEDSYPTAIYFRYDGVGNRDPANPATSPLAYPLIGSVTMAYGTENLPALANIRFFAASPSRTTNSNPTDQSDYNVTTFGGWWQPGLWNIHQAPVKDFKSRPNSFEIRAYGASLTTWQKENYDTTKHTYGSSLTSTVRYDTQTNTLDVNDIGKVRFQLGDSLGASKFCFYEMPYPLIDGLGNNVSANSPFPGNSGNATFPFYNEELDATWNSRDYHNNSTFSVVNHFVAFSAGVTPTAANSDSTHRPFFVDGSSTMTVASHPDADPNTYILGWRGANDSFHPYSFITGAFTYELLRYFGTDLQVGSANPGHGNPSDQTETLNTDVFMLADPRTERFSLGRCENAGLAGTISTNWRGMSGLDGNGRYGPVARPSDPGFKNTYYQDYSFASGDLQTNVESASNTHICYYQDSDGIVRPGDGFYFSSSTGDGLMTFITPTSYSDTTVSSTDKSVPADKPTVKHGRRPIVLNRPFVSVAELGYVFRDEPFKSLNFFTDKSADAELLDVFSVIDTTTITLNKLSSAVSGKINPNAVSKQVVAALIQGGSKKQWDTNYNLGAESPGIGDAFVSQIVQSSTSTTYAPVDGYRGLASALANAVRNNTTGNAPDKANKVYLEAPLRAMSESTNFRTWNLMVDLIAQSGQISANAKSLSDFAVQAESHVWVHVAIDRYTGEIIARQVEPVYE